MASSSGLVTLPVVAFAALVGIVLFVVFKKFGRRGKALKKYTPEQEAEIIAKWKPLPLRTQLTSSQLRNEKELIITKSSTTRVTLNGVDDIIHAGRANYLGMSGNAEVNKIAEETMRTYGVGSCGPRGFYGTIDVHLDLEKKISTFMNTDDAILYSSGFATVSSAIPAFSKRGDLIICDESVSYPISAGIILSRSNVRYFKHNDVKDLERILQETMPKSKKELVRKFVVIEALYYNYGDIAPLKEIMALKNKYFFRIIMDETHSIGVLGKTGRGLCEHTGVKQKDIDILTGSLSYAFGGAGGYCVGSRHVVYHQRLNGAGYCFSASMPPYLTVSAHKAMEMLERDHEKLLPTLRKKIATLHSGLKQIPGLKVEGDLLSPVIHVRLAKSLGTRDDDEDILEAIVDYAIKRHKVFLTRAKYVDTERNTPPPSIRVCVNAAFDESELLAIISAIRDGANAKLPK